MADVKISQLPVATTPVDGTEVLPIVQSATTKQVSIANLTAGRAMSASSLTLTTPLAVTSGGTGIATAAQGSLLSATGADTFSATRTPTLGLAGTAAGTLGLSGSSSGVVTLATAATTNNWTFTLPTNAGTNNFILTTNGSGVTQWTNPTALGIDLDVGSTAITGGTTGRVLYNNAGVLGEYSVTGTGSVVLGTTPTFTTSALFPAGTVSAPGVSVSGDTNTGIYFPAADTIGFVEGGVEAMRLDASGNLGLGVTPSAWGSANRAIDLLGGYGSLATWSSDGSVNVTTNAYRNSSNNWIYNNSFFASRYEQVNSEHRWFIAPSGTANAAISFTRAMTLDASGRLSIGTTSSAGVLTLSDTGATTGRVQLNGTTNYSVFQAKNTGGDFYFGIDNSAGSGFSAGAYGRVLYSSGAYPMLFITNDVERMRIDASGRLLVNSTSPYAKTYLYNADGGDFPLGVAGTTKGFRVLTDSNGTKIQGVDNTLVGSYQPLSIGGSIVTFEYNATEVARITNSGKFLIGTTTVSASTAAFLTIGGDSSSSRVLPRTDNVGYVGDSGQRWQAIYAVNGTIQTSDANEKNTIVDSNLGLAFINDLRPVSYKWNVGENIITYGEDGNEIATPRPGIRTHYGLIAQEVKSAIPEGVDFGGFVQEPNDGVMSLRYHEFIGPMIKAIQELAAKVSALEAKQ